MDAGNVHFKEYVNFRLFIFRAPLSIVYVHFVNSPERFISIVSMVVADVFDVICDDCKCIFDFVTDRHLQCD